MIDDLDDCWCDIVDHVDHADRKQGLPRDIFAVRCSVNRGPLMIDHEDLKKLNYLDQAFVMLSCLVWTFSLSLGSAFVIIKGFVFAILLHQL